LAISFQCSHCHSKLKVGAELAGKRGKCPKCHATVSIPAASVDTPPQGSPIVRSDEIPVVERSGGIAIHTTRTTKAAVAQPIVDREQLRAKILTSFRGDIAPITGTGISSIRLLFTTVVLFLIPLAYSAFIGAIVVALVWHLSTNMALMPISAWLYWGPLAVGAAALPLLLKPLLLAPGATERLRPATRRQEPLLFDFIDQVCKQVQATAPNRIDFDCSMNARADRSGGFGSELTLEIGLPLLCCMSIDEFAGVVAREFGHFSRSCGGRWAVFCCGIHDWLVRVVCQRDRFDRWLDGVTSQPLGYVLLPLSVGTWLVRQLLWPALALAHWLVADLIRRREENSYRYEARLIGSEQFVKLQELQDVLEFAWQGAHADLEFQHRERQLVDNLPRQVLHNFIAIPAEVCSALVGSVPPPPPEPYSCQLTEIERLALAHGEHAPGVLKNELPAYLLLKDFDSLARDLTWDYYLRTFGPPLVRRDLKPVARVEHE
jgi:hypothetical protein